MKEISRREKDSLKITDNRAICEEGTSRKYEVKWRVCEIRLEQRGGSSYGKGGR